MTKYGICETSVIPIRKEPNDRSEMVSQLLFGETFQVLEETIKWTYIKLTLDNYTGWVDNKETKLISEEDLNSFQNSTNIITNNIFTKVINAKDELLILPPGCTLPNFNGNDSSFFIGRNHYKLVEKYIETTEINKLAKQFVNAPYLWGGKNPFGYDCSGFVQVIYKILGKYLPRDASQQVNVGNNINFISDINPGDLAFFDDEEGNIIHVGIILKNREIIHSSGKVRIDRLDQQGIYNIDLKKYTHKLRVIKRVLN